MWVESTIRCGLCPGRVAIRFLVLARFDRACTTTRADRPAAASAFSWAALIGPDEQPWNLVVGPVVRVPVAPNLLFGNVEVEDDAGGSGRAGIPHLLVERCEIGPGVGPSLSRKVGRDVQREELDARGWYRGLREVPDHDLAGGVLSRDLLAGRQVDEGTAGSPVVRRPRVGHGAGHRDPSGGTAQLRQPELAGPREIHARALPRVRRGLPAAHPIGVRADPQALDPLEAPIEPPKLLVVRPAAGVAELAEARHLRHRRPQLGCAGEGPIVDGGRAGRRSRRRRGGRDEQQRGTDHSNAPAERPPHSHYVGTITSIAHQVKPAIADSKGLPCRG